MAKIKCPDCGHEQELEVPDNKCLWCCKCEGCGMDIKAPEDKCCVVCAYSEEGCNCEAANE